MDRRDKLMIVETCLLALFLAAVIIAAVSNARRGAREAEQLRTALQDAVDRAFRAEENLDRLKRWMDERGLPTESAQPTESAPGEAEPGETQRPATGKCDAASTENTDPYFPNGMEPAIEIYLGWRETYPEGYANLIRWGRGETPPVTLPPPMAEAARIAYDGYRWDSWIELRLGERATQSPYHGRGQECAYFLWRRGRNIENALATLEAESTYGLGGDLHFGILYPGYPNTLEGYCDLLDTWSDSTDPWSQACFWNMPGYPRYQRGFVEIAETVRGWRP